MFGAGSRTAKQIQILVPALIFTFIGITCAGIFGYFAYSSQYRASCCLQVDGIAYQTSSSDSNIPELVRLRFGGKIPSYCFQRSYSFSEENSDTTEDHGKSAASLLCFRGAYKTIYVRGGDSYGVLAVSIGGVGILLGVLLIMVLFMELFLGSWFIERRFWPRLVQLVKDDP